jgi:hypothetical protein
MPKDSIINGSLRGVKVTESEEVTHVQFVDDIFCSVKGTNQDVRDLNGIFNIKATRMSMNMDK